MKKRLLLLFLGCFSVTIWATSPTDTVRTMRTTTMPKSRFSLGAELSVRSGGDYRVEQDGESVEKGKSDFYTKATIRASLPVYQKDRTFVSTSLKYSHIHQHFTPESQQLDYGFGATAHHIFSANVMGMGRMRLWNKSLILMGMASGECSQYGFERWMAMGTAVVMLKETQQTQFGIGLLGMLNTFSKIPVFPFFTYRHTFNKQWLLNLTPPTMQARYSFSRTDALSLGMAIDADHYFIHPDTEGLPDRVRYNRCVMNFSPTYEHRFPTGLTFTADIGLSVLMTNRISKSGGSQQIADMHEKAALYCRIGIQQRF